VLGFEPPAFGPNVHDEEMRVVLDEQRRFGEAPDRM